MKLTLSAYEKKSINSSGGYFTVSSMDASSSVELSFKGSDDIPLENGSQINVGDAAKVSLQNLTDSSVEIEYSILTAAIERKAQAVKAEIINKLPIKVQFDDAFTVGAVQVLSATTNTHQSRVPCLPGQATKLFDAGTRKSCRINIRSDQFNGVSLGGDNTVNDSNGGYLDVGMVDYIDTSGALWAFNNGDSTVFVDVLELA